MRIPVPRTLASAIDSHDNGFNAVRLVCALMVVAYHAWQMNPVFSRTDPLTRLMAPAMDTGTLAVGVFFIISGLFVTQSWMRDPQPLRFAARRIARIVPGLFVCLLVTTVLAVVFFSDTGAAGLASGAPWRYIFGSSVLHLLQYNIPPEELRIAGVLGGIDLNGPLWTLYWEGRMYVMVALIGLAAVLPMRVWMRNAAIFLLLAAHLFPSVLSGYVWEVRMWSLFLFGMLLQTVAAHARIGPVHVLCALALLLLNWTRNASLTDSPLTFFGVMLVAGAAALWIGSARTRALQHFRTHDYSFGIYIWHWPVLLMLRAVLPPLDALPLFAVSLAVIVPVAMLSWHFVEAPAIRTVRRLMRERANDRAAAPSN
ncbi:acyltransferase family protein [Pseudoduganella sp. GCM10020061]|uniref:acyltransferase family protein n=1 Tax=Pseudoduganella sp. GCM10020061 TaxID=3317345 RepID=UPI003632519F